MKKTPPNIGEIWKVTSKNGSRLYHYFVLDANKYKDLFCLLEIGGVGLKIENVPIKWEDPAWELVGDGEGTTSNSGMKEIA